MTPFPSELLSVGPVVVTDTVVISLVVSLLLVVCGRLAMRWPRTRLSLEIAYDLLERSILDVTRVDVRPLVPLVLTQWLFIGVTNLVGILPGLQSPTRDLSLAAALALISFGAGHVFAFRERGIAYLKQYLDPTPVLLPFNIIGELTRTLALALRLFGNMLSGALVGAIFLYVAGLLVPVPLMLLSVLTGVVQAYIFGVLTLVFAASSLESGLREQRRAESRKPAPKLPAPAAPAAAKEKP